MHLDNASGPVPLTPGSTLLLTRQAPWLVSLLAVTVAVLAWLGLGVQGG